MSKETISVIKNEAIKLIPKGILSIILVGSLAYGYINTLIIFPASVDSNYSVQKSNFVKTSLMKVDKNYDIPHCRIYEVPGNLSTCNDYEATKWAGKYYCFYPLFNGRCVNR